VIDHRIAAAPISWGVSEVPGWGHQLPPERVLGDMRDLGLAATEFGPDGFLPDSPEAKAATLAGYGLRAVGGFLPVVLHDPLHDPLPEVDLFIDALLTAHAGVVVLAAHSGTEGYDDRPVLDDTQWKAMLVNLDRLGAHAQQRGVTVAIHPHVGTMVESAADVERVLADSRIGLCIDTGHLLVGGADPVAITQRFTDRVVHVHLKDVDQQLAARVLNGEIMFADAVDTGLFRVLGEGDVNVETLVRTLELAGYDGWYVLEQDLKLGAEPTGEGPIVNVRASLEYLKAITS